MKPDQSRRESPKGSTVTNPKLHPLIRGELRLFANYLRQKYPNKTIRNAVVFESGIRILSEHDLIQLIGGEHQMPDWMPPDFNGMLKRIKNHPIWVPGSQYPQSDRLMYLLEPRLLAGKIYWRYTPSTKATFKEMMQERPRGS